ncbi:hypothetical protein B5K11_09005 [Rhizobium leguminosarum bv. trifolii]|nr:hypothetical protein B5K11_09005 [Rhizobium leguminosarum bv. trifolii]
MSGVGTIAAQIRRRASIFGLPHAGPRDGELLLKADTILKKSFDGGSIMLFLATTAFTNDHQRNQPEREITV